MHPTFIEILGFEIHTYGVLLALGFAGALVIATNQARRDSIPKEVITDLGLVALIAGIIGARLLFIATEWEEFIFHPWGVLFSRSGFVFYGGLLLAVPAGILYLRRKKAPILPTADAIAPGLALAQVLGRLGCFSQGCCYGAPTDQPWGIAFPSGAPAALRFGMVPVHPTQLYESIGCLVIFFVLILFSRRRPFPGAVLLLYLALYPPLRFVIEFFRADYRGDFIGPFSISQVISILLFLLSVVLLYRGRRTGGAA